MDTAVMIIPISLLAQESFDLSTFESFFFEMSFIEVIQHRGNNFGTNIPHYVQKLVFHAIQLVATLSGNIYKILK
jgi:hypothetical protein